MGSTSSTPVANGDRDRGAVKPGAAGRAGSEGGSGSNGVAKPPPPPPSNNISNVNSVTVNVNSGPLGKTAIHQGPAATSTGSPMRQLGLEWISDHRTPIATIGASVSSTLVAVCLERSLPIQVDDLLTYVSTLWTLSRPACNRELRVFPFFFLPLCPHDTILTCPAITPSSFPPCAMHLSTRA